MFWHTGLVIATTLFCQGVLSLSSQIIITNQEGRDIDRGGSDDNELHSSTISTQTSDILPTMAAFNSDVVNMSTSEPPTRGTFPMTSLETRTLSYNIHPSLTMEISSSSDFHIPASEGVFNSHQIVSSHLRIFSVHLSNQIPVSSSGISSLSDLHAIPMISSHSNGPVPDLSSGMGSATHLLDIPVISSSMVVPTRRSMSSSSRSESSTQMSQFISASDTRPHLTSSMSAVTLSLTKISNSISTIVTTATTIVSHSHTTLPPFMSSATPLTDSTPMTSVPPSSSTTQPFNYKLVLYIVPPLLVVLLLLVVVTLVLCCKRYRKIRRYQQHLVPLTDVDGSDDSDLEDELDNREAAFMIASTDLSTRPMLSFDES